MFQLIEGRLSEKYNHFTEMLFDSCQATATRLNGTAALKITWKGKKRYWDHYFQIILLDCIDHKIKEYNEYDCTAYADMSVENKAAMISRWNSLRTELGGKVVTVKPEAMIRLLESAQTYNDHISARLMMAAEELEAEGINSASCSEIGAAAAVSETQLATCDTINYFVSKLACGDIEGAAILSIMPEDRLRQCEIVKAFPQKLIRNSIQISNAADDPSEDGTSYPYRCKAITELHGRLYFYTYVIWLNGDYKVKDPKVTDIKIGTALRLSAFEEKFHRKSHEYIAVFGRVNSSKEYADSVIVQGLADCAASKVPNGVVYTIANKNGSYINKTEYNIENRHYGQVLLTNKGEMILMSHNLDHIGELEYKMTCLIAPHMTVKGRYNIENNSAFDAICNIGNAEFKELITTEESAGIKPVIRTFR